MSESISPDEEGKRADALAHHRASLDPKVQRLLAEDELRETLAEQTETSEAAIEAMSLVREYGHRRAHSIAYHVLQAELGYRVAVFEAVDGQPIEAGEDEQLTRGDYQREVLRWIDEYRSMLPRWRRLLGLGAMDAQESPRSRHLPTRGNRANPPYDSTPNESA